MRINKPQPALSPSQATSAADIEADFWRELQALETMHQQEMAELEAESIGWTELAPGTYLHTANEQATVIDIVGIATASMAADNVLWLV
jgi:hypothetical protein